MTSEWSLNERPNILSEDIASGLLFHSSQYSPFHYRRSRFRKAPTLVASWKFWLGKTPVVQTNMIEIQTPVPWPSDSKLSDSKQHIQNVHNYENMQHFILILVLLLFFFIFRGRTKTGRVIELQVGGATNARSDCSPTQFSRVVHFPNYYTVGPVGY